ncbi:MAG: hypothetical protein EOO38_10675 [Cytophagaceae bacterium]|nr:MAG: hypothetical protein EOO38_10675 [Cytophagaceae bacterium]
MPIAGPASVPFDDRYTPEINRRLSNEDLTSRVRQPPQGEVSPREHKKAPDKSVSSEISRDDFNNPGLDPGHGKRPREEVREGSSVAENPPRKRTKLSEPASQLPDDPLPPRAATQEGSSKIQETAHGPGSGTATERNLPEAHATAAVTHQAITPDNSVIRPLTRWSLPVSLTDQWRNGVFRRGHASKHGKEFGLSKKENSKYYELAAYFFQKPLDNLGNAIEVGRIEEGTGKFIGLTTIVENLGFYS